MKYKDLFATLVGGFSRDAYVMFEGDNKMYYLGTEPAEYYGREVKDLDILVNADTVSYEVDEEPKLYHRDYFKSSSLLFKVKLKDVK